METYQDAETYFDSPARKLREEIEADAAEFRRNPFVRQILDGFPDLAVVLNQNRQIVSYNKKAERIFSGLTNPDIYGQRLGEALNCIHSHEMPAGCGTSLFCKECGAAQSIKFTNENKAAAQNECRITVHENGAEAALDFRVNTSVLHFKESEYILFSVEDIKDEKRRRVLERVFFHDVLNTASAIQGIAEIIPDVEQKIELEEFHNMLRRSSGQLIEEIQWQRDLMSAESGTLPVNIKSVTVNEMLEGLKSLYSDHHLTKNKKFKTEKVKQDIKFNSDPTLLTRSLGNLVKNALEAVNANDTVRLFAESDAESVKFHVANDGVIPENIQLQIFQRSFSTKAETGRGIGTYSVKLFVEQFLKGKVYFISNKEAGTIFTIQLPLNN